MGSKQKFKLNLNWIVKEEKDQISLNSPYGEKKKYTPSKHLLEFLIIKSCINQPKSLKLITQDIQNVLNVSQK